MRKVGDVVYTMGEPDQFGRVFSYRKLTITSVVEPGTIDPLYGRIESYIVDNEQHVCDFEVFDSEKDVINHIRNRNKDTKVDTLYDAELQLRYYTSLKDAWERFDPMQVKITELILPLTSNRY